MQYTTTIWATPVRMRMDTKQMVIELARLRNTGKRKSTSQVDIVHDAIERELKRERKLHEKKES